ncbi:unnamed protein product [marine sediment metagenome]|uniref:Helix-turn-helix domain-containing protein n=1 Tax=marine sediment metagenome TaxID=412755 RepID=X0W5V0_9ZZZZ
MLKRQCIECDNPIPLHYIGRRCSECLIAALESTTYTSPDPYNVRDMADILNLTSEEQVRRLSREGKIPGRIPGIKQHLFIQPIVNKWLKQNQTLPKIPTNPLQAEAKARCDNKDHDWLYDERFNGIAYISEEGAKQQSEKVISTGHDRTCYFCGYSTFVSSMHNY